MDDLEKSMKIKMLQETLKRDFSISSTAELISAVRAMVPVDISVCVTEPGLEESFS